MTPLSYHSLNLSLIARETMQLLVLILNINTKLRLNMYWRKKDIE